MKKRFDRFHPLVSFSYYVGALALLMLLFHPIVLSAALSMIFAVHFVQDRCKSLQRWLFFMISTGLIIFIINPLFNHNGDHVLFEIYQRPFTLEAIMFGVTTGLSIMGIIAIFVSFNEIMTPNKLFYLFSKFLPQFAVLLMLTLRFIPLMRRRLEEIAAIQASKGISVLYGSWKNRTKSGLLYVQVLLTYSLEEAIQTADSMNARGYGQGRRSTYEYFKFKKSDMIAMIYLMAVFIVTLYGRFTGNGILTVYPIMEPVHLSIMDMVTSGEFLLFLGFPLFVDIGGIIRWRKLN